MPGLLTLRPLASAAKAAKSTAAKNVAVSAARGEKGRDDARPQGQGRAVSPAFSQARVLRAPVLHRDAPGAPPATHHHHLHQHPQQHQQRGTQAQKLLACRTSAGATITKQVSDPIIGNAAAAAANGNQYGLEIIQRGGGVDYSSSGSEHEPNSVCLAEMVCDYFEDDLELEVSKCGRTRCNCGNSCSSGELSSVKENDDASLGGETVEVLQGLIACGSPCEKIILASVTSALAAFDSHDNGSEPADEEECLESSRSPSTRRSVMSALRASGYNAAICKSRWEHAGGFPGGDYEYIDVIVEVGGKAQRVIVDADFKAQFEIARPTGLYSALLQSLPRIYVGKADRLQQIVNIMCDSAKRSLKKKGLHLPPWRKPDYIRAKWFSAYRRTTNGASSSSIKSGIDIGKIALRSSAWDSKFTTELEKRYVKAVDLKMALKECTADDRRAAMLQQQLMKPQPAVEPEGKVRGANLMGFLWLGSDHSAAAGDSDLTMATEWEPPSVIPRTSTHRAAAGKVGGLVSILKESSAEIAEEDGALRAHEAQEQVAIAGLHRHQAGAIPKRIVVV